MSTYKVELTDEQEKCLEYIIKGTKISKEEFVQNEMQTSANGLVSQWTYDHNNDVFNAYRAADEKQKKEVDSILLP